MNFNYDTGTISVLQYLDPTVAAPLNGSIPANVLFINGPGAVLVPTGNTAARPVPDAVSNPAATGMFRYNTSGGALEYFDGLNWQTLSYASGAVSSFSAGTTGLTPSTPTTGAVVLGGTLGVSNGGTGSTATPANGQILVGNGTSFTVATLGTGTGISTTVGSGSLQINNTGVTSLVAGTGVSISSSTGAVTVSNTGVTSFQTSMSGLSPNTATTGAITLSGILGLSSGGTNSNLSGSNGSIIYNNGTSLVNSSVGTLNQALISSGAGAPTWLDVTSTLTTNQILQGDGTGSFTANGGSFVGSPTYSGVTLQGTVTNATDAVTKAYVDAAIAGINVHPAVDYFADGTNTQISGSTYANGVAGFAGAGLGVGATLTDATVGSVLMVDGFAPAHLDRILVNTFTNGTASANYNGIYVLTTVGVAGTTPWVLTRATDYNNSQANQVGPGDFTFVYKGTNYASTGWVQIDVGSGYTGADADAIIISKSTDVPAGNNIYWTQFSGTGTYLAGAGLSLVGTTFNVKTDGVTTYINGSNDVAVLSSSTANQVLLSAGSGNTATWGAVPLNNSNAVTGVLNLANGGTGTNLTNVPGAVVYGGPTGMDYTAVGTAGQVLVSSGTGTPVWQNFSADAVTTFQTSLSGLTPSTPTMGAVTLAGTLGATSGGTGSTATPTNGQLLIGNGTSYTTASVTAGSGISTTVGAGSLQINNTGVLSLANTDGNISVSSSTGNVTINLASTLNLGAVTVTSLTDTGLTNQNGAVYVGAGGLLSETSSLTNGQIMIGSSSGAPIAATLTAGTGIGIANGANSITISNTGVTGVSLNTVTLPDAAILTTTPIATSTGSVAETITFNTQNANLVLAGPSTGAAAQPSFRSLVYADLPLKLYVENPSSPVAPVATGTNSVAIGSGSTAAATDSFALGNGSNAYLYGADVFANGQFGSTPGSAQGGNYVLRNQTTDATPTALSLDGTGVTNLLVFPDNSVVTFDILIAAYRTDGTSQGAGYRFVGVIKKDATAASNGFIGSFSKTVIGETVAAWDATITAGTINGELGITVTGANSAAINWVATVRTTEVTLNV